MDRLGRAIEVATVVIVFGLAVFMFHYHPAWWILAIFILIITDDRRTNKQ